MTKRPQPRINLAAFGKHPGWEDHLPGIGLETAGLAEIKQALYVSGIGGQIDAGAWEPAKMEPEKRLAGFDHWFLWRRAGTLYCGRFWSSRDRVGRKEYPMVLCLESTGVAPAILLAKAWPELERLRKACVSADTSDKVVEECRASQEHFRRVAAELSGTTASAGVEDAAKRDFLERPELGPDRLGLLRVLHELDRTVHSNGRGEGSSSGSFDASRSYHLRVPRGCETDGGGLLLWLEFLSCSLPFAPVLLLARADAGWLDIVFGEPESSDLYCLQASPKALPLATEIPYELEPGLTSRLKELEVRFLAQPPAGEAAKPSLPPKSEPPPSGEKEWGAPDRAESKGGGMRWVLILAGLLLVIGIPLVWLMGRGGESASRTSESVTAPQVEQNKDTARFETLVAEGNKLLQQAHYTDAAARFDEALKIKPGDEGAKRLRDEVQSRIAAVASAQADEAKYETALNAAQAAQAASKWTETMRQADLALAIKPGDAAATKLKADAQSKEEAASQAERDYHAATDAAGAALKARDFVETVRQADKALALKPNDPVAMRLKTEAQNNQSSFARAQQDYQAATNAAAMAFSSKDYAAAIRQADIALRLKPDDATALKLKTEAQREQAATTAAADEYQSAMNAAARALESQNYEETIRQADVALTLRPGDPAATKSKADARELQKEAVIQTQYETAMSKAHAALEQKDYAGAVQQSDAALSLKPNDSDATSLKSEVQRLEKEALAAQQYDAAMQEGRSALARKDYQAALDQADQALKTRPESAEAAELKTRASAGMAQQKVKDLIAAGKYDEARTIYQTHSSDEAFGWVPKAIEEAQSKRSGQQLVKLDADLQKLLVKFNVLSPKDDYIQSPDARKESQWSGRIGLQGVDYYLRVVDQLEQGFSTGGWLDQNDRRKYLKELRSAIPLWQ